MNNIDISRERKEKAIILFRKLGFNTKLGTDQERESVRRRLGEAMQFDELI
jgi:hypothetical protein